MIMVRRNELACRDQWSHDLWEDRGVRAPSPAASPLAPFPVRRMEPATPDEIAAVAQPRAAAPEGASGAMPATGVAMARGEHPAEDVVVGETRVIGEPERDWTWEREEEAASREVDTRTAIIKAREAHRERLKLGAASRATQRADEVPASPGDDRAPDRAPEEPPAVLAERSTGDDRNGVTPPPVELRRPAAVSRGDGDFDTVPEMMPGFSLPTRPVSRASERLGREGRPYAQEAASDARASTGDVERRAERQVPRSAATPVAQDRRAEWTSERPRPSALANERPKAGPPMRGERAAVDGRPRIDVTGERDRDARALLAGRGGGEQRSDRSVSGFGPEPDAGRFADDVVAGDDTSSEMLAGVSEADAKNDEAVAAEDILVPNPTLPFEPLVDLEIKVAPEVVRICRTCRDFRPAEGSGRGWCANEWAFTHRRMVDGEDPMPCETSLGSWWLPADEVWVARADVSSHGQPTPLMDAVVGHFRDEPLRRRGS